ncbi:MAG: alpha-mannosidase, partial [Oscillospiraceae bacterium]
MIEMARRCRDLDGVPKSEHRLVGDFAKEIEENAVDAPTYTGELYLELHRGTLTNQHVIKQNNRRAEIALHNAELLLTAQAVKNGEAASGDGIRPLMETLLVNQFHDILPGTCIARAHDQCHREMAEVLAKTDAILRNTVAATPADDRATFVNPLSFARQDVLRIPGAQGKTVEGGYAVQHVHSLLDGDYLAVAGVTLPAMSSITLHLKESGGETAPSAFLYQGNTLTTPFAKVVFNETGS